MQCCTRILRVLFFLLSSSSMALADDETQKRNPFTDDFLEICGAMVLSGNAPTFWTSYLRKIPLWPAQFLIETTDGKVTCIYSASYRSDVSFKPEQKRPAYQPHWLENPELIGTLFDAWIHKYGLEVDLHPNTECLISPWITDTITETVYARGVTIGDTGRAITVEITRLVDSYLDPDLGFTLRFNARSSNFRVPCA